MLRCGHGWQPSTIDRVIETYPTSTRVAKVKTDQGIAFVKGMGNPSGNQSLAMELVGSELASQMGLFVPDFAIVDVSEIEIPMDGCGSMQFGPAFASRDTLCIPSDGTNYLINKLRDVSELARLVVFDTWIRNLDRCPPLDYIDPDPRQDNLCFTSDGERLKLMVIDHSHCFVEGVLDDEIGSPHFVNDPRIYGCFPEFSPYLSENSLLQAIGALASIDAATVADIVNSVPLEWGLTQGCRNSWISQIVSRQAWVAGSIVASLVPQGQMGF